MKILKKIVKDVKDNNKGLILYGRKYVFGVFASVVGRRVGNSIIKK